MNENDKNPMNFRDIAVSIALLTRLPIRLHSDSFARGARAAWAYPLAGVTVALLSAALAWVMLLWGAGSATVALLILAFGVVVTGAMHEDGLADCSDGFWGGWTRERRLEIMKDSQIGSYGVLALVLAMAARWWGLTLMIEARALLTLVAIAALSRGAMVVVMATLPHARSNGLSHAQGRPTALTATMAVGIAAIVAVISCGAAAVLMLAVSALTALGVAMIARAKIGGQTGDVLGATQVMVEIALLLVLFG